MKLIICDGIDPVVVTEAYDLTLATKGSPDYDPDIQYIEIHRSEGEVFSVEIGRDPGLQTQEITEYATFSVTHADT